MRTGFRANRWVSRPDQLPARTRRGYGSLDLAACTLGHHPTFGTIERTSQRQSRMFGRTTGDLGIPWARRRDPRLEERLVDHAPVPRDGWGPRIKPDGWGPPTIVARTCNAASDVQTVRVLVMVIAHPSRLLVATTAT
jgi:hypothetical protein